MVNRFAVDDEFLTECFFLFVDVVFLTDYVRDKRGNHAYVYVVSFCVVDAVVYVGLKRLIYTRFYYQSYLNKIYFVTFVRDFVTKTVD